MPSQHEIREQITKQIIDALESGVRPWRRPWAVNQSSGRHRNYTSQRSYSGINPTILQLHSLEHGFTSPLWATFKQWQEVGGRVMQRPKHVKPGCWGAKIVFFAPVKKAVINHAGDEEEKCFPILRTFTVFNLDQVDGLDLQSEPANTNAEPDFAPAEQLIAATGADIHIGGNRAFYQRPTPEGSYPNHIDGDFIAMPPKAQFERIGGYYETALHELAHWSEVRVGWDHASHGYAMGELVAEMASCYLSTELGIPNGEGLDNHASYLQSWLTAMKDDPRYIFRAATQASKITDFLLSFVREPVEEEVVA